MSRRRYTPEQIIGKLREAEVALAHGGTAAQVCRSLGIAEQTFYRWRREYGGLKVEQAKLLKVLEQENSRLRPRSVTRRGLLDLSRYLWILKWCLGPDSNRHGANSEGF